MHICPLEPTISFGKPLTSISGGFEQDRPSPLVPYLGSKEMIRVACPLATVVLGWNPVLPRDMGEKSVPSPSQTRQVDAVLSYTGWGTGTTSLQV